ncbi:Lrp/AsnC family transcriptional regulator [Lactiplantibacillus fabifermentans]|nr:AsnC family transcriptional regulator [Lactiplantibacillus fabifermentans]ETY75384.1 transcriptional regulator [Lactiplantibacillus fabifermentans T30PCM01]
MLDNTDKQILKQLNRDARIKMTTLAKQVHLTAPAVTARVDRLQATGVIQRYTIETNLEKLGYDRQVFIQAAVRAEKYPAYLRFIKHYRNNLRHHYRTAGEMNYLIEAAFTSRATLNPFLTALNAVAAYQVIDVLAELD